ncbi:transporter [Phytohalomonas tamaricis]|uniref:transporter n=1 Tax=Phytohalomonas tamaricis TaxID=2081032 RepID=UPI000D0AFF38|nr:transporter [Phytohalomonas tamaricis]
MKINRTYLVSIPFTALVYLSEYSYAAGTIDARDFIAAPPGTAVSVLYYGHQSAHDFAGAPPRGKENLEVNSLLYRQVWYSDVCGNLCTPQFILPYADINLRMPGSVDENHASGIGDPLFGGAFFLFNNPHEKYYSGIMALVSLPLGEYDSNSPGTSPGANRWEVLLTYNNTIGVGENWYLESNLEAEVYGNNNDYLGETLEQSPILSAQFTASYDFTSSIYGALSLMYKNGGEIKLNGTKVPDTRLQETRGSIAFGFDLDRNNKLMISYSSPTNSKNTFRNDEMRVRFSHTW